ncbi:MAG TPA: hypothetical protein VNT27_10870 [Propionibacteriaceae bacterium]|nr:hypothetical protein [Propionibacteriaceae bacterium]
MAITLAQAERLNEINAHRHDLTHELIKYIIDVRFEPDVELLAAALCSFVTSAVSGLGSRWTWGHSNIWREVDVDEVQPLSLIVFQMCLDAYVAGLPRTERQR